MSRIVLGPLAASFLEAGGLDAWKAKEAVLMTSNDWAIMIHENGLNIELRYALKNNIATLRMGVTSLGIQIQEMVIPGRPCRTRIDMMPQEVPTTISQSLIGEPFSRLVQGPAWLNSVLCKEPIERYYDDTGVFHGKTIKAQKAILLKRGTSAMSTPGHNQCTRITRI